MNKKQQETLLELIAVLGNFEDNFYIVSNIRRDDIESAIITLMSERNNLQTLLLRLARTILSAYKSKKNDASERIANQAMEYIKKVTVFDDAFLRTVKKSPYLCGGSGYIRVNPDGSPSKMGLTHYECPGCSNCNYEEIYCGSLDLESEDKE